jgi:hypothetical protein
MATPWFSKLLKAENRKAAQWKSQRAAKKDARECNRSEAGESLTPDALKVLTKNSNRDATGWF